ncbi:MULTISPECIES: BLUF domain-containing protein [unclassified Brevundimonas]|uniref:BLUF domain-containing protein n=1 Tax=unclassified Brevundimonas TaxID=2622653 RepID=UPI003F9366C5
MPLHRAIYVSDAVADAATSLLVLAEILGVSERNNRRDGLTGVLMRHGGRFLQAIEGHRADVDRLMDRLRADPRHENIRLLSDQDVPCRLFPEWPMTLAELTPAAARLLNGATLDQLGPDRAEVLLSTAAQALPVPA